MSQSDAIDAFESRFRRSDRPAFTLSPLRFSRLVMVHDATCTDPRRLLDALDDRTGALSSAKLVGSVAVEEVATAAELIERVGDHSPDLVVTYRHLGERLAGPAHSLGTVVDTLTQASPHPVLLLPGLRDQPHRLVDPVEEVLCVTEHLRGNDRLVNASLGLANPAGKLILCHVEDEAVFGRYAEAISRLPDLPTEKTLEELKRQLVRDAEQFIAVCGKRLGEAGSGFERLTVEGIVASGHSVRFYRELVDSRAVDLVAVDSKDDTQLAMDGLAYALAIELTDIACLLL